VIPLLGANRSIVKHGLIELNQTKRPGLLAMFNESAITKGEIGTYQVGWLISPRINAMGRLEHAMDSLRLLCTTNRKRADEIARHIGRINKKRQDVVEEIVAHAEKSAKKKGKMSAIVIAHESYHEGIIGLAASRLVEKFYRPAIVMSKGKKVSKASARSITGFNIIEAIRELDVLIDGGGGHPMAAGFSIKTKNIKKFEKKFIELSSKLLTDEILERSLKVDLEISFDSINKTLVDTLQKFEPTGVGNPTMTFCTPGVQLIDYKTVGRESKHLKLKVEKNGRAFNAIAFGMGYFAQKLEKGNKISIAYNLEENEWNGNKYLQLKVRDVNSLI
jgi:single-stranded-DNA-specific exonuclease